MQSLVLPGPGMLRSGWPVAAATAAAVVYVYTVPAGMEVPPASFVDVVASVMVCLTLALRHRCPEAVVIVALGVGAWAIWSDSLARDVAQVVVLAGLYATAMRRHLAVSMVLGCITTAIGMVALLHDRAPMSSDLTALTVLAMASTVATPILLGRQVRSAQRTGEDALALATETERRRLAEAENHTAAERARIARDVHDIVAHHVSSIVVQASAARFAATTHPQEVLPALERIRDAGDLTLRNLRHLLDLLHDPDESPGVAPGPSLPGIADLIEQARQQGTPVSLQFGGDLTGIDAASAACAYRLVQEGLTNAAKHAGPTTPVQVQVIEDRGTLQVHLHNGPPADPGWINPMPSTRHGLQGMRTRVTLLGGTITAGRTGDGWTVAAVLPAEHQAAAS